jgi:hypothetical protein
VDVSACVVSALYDARLPVGASGVDAVVRVAASGIEEAGVAAALRLWTPVGATVAALRSPATGDLRGAAIRRDDRTVEYPAGRWTDGAREYELVVALPAREAGDEMLAARLDVVLDGELVGGARITVTWGDDARPTAASAGSHPGRPRVVTAEELPTGGSASHPPRPPVVTAEELPAGGSASHPARPPVVTAEELPTGASPQARHTLVDEPHAAEPCAGCGLRPEDGDRFCEGCGRKLVADAAR